MNILKKIRNYFFYCGIEKDEYNAVKKDAYISNFQIWKILNIFISVVFVFLFISSLFNNMLRANMVFYLIGMIYSLLVSLLFFILKKESIIAQLLIYLSITMLFVFGCLITQNKPTVPATTFIVFLLITPMFMIDKPYFMTIELLAASTIFCIWMYNVKPYEVWQYDLINIITYTIIGIFIHIVSASIRIKEFVLKREINIQKDIDDLTGLKNKGALTREINEYLDNNSKNKGILLLLDIDHFKKINDTYGHDYGDEIIKQLGKYLGKLFTNGEVVGRFGGDEFLIFIKDTDSNEFAESVAKVIISDTTDNIKLPSKDQLFSVSIGIAIYHGIENNYSEIFKKADVALYKTKADKSTHYSIY